MTMDRNYRRRNVMKTIKTAICACAVLTLGALFLTTRADASSGDFYPSYVQARVIGHLPLSGGARRMFLQQEGRTQYLYVQQPSQQGFTVIDVRKPDRPKVVNHMRQENLTMVASGLAISQTPDNSATVGTSRATGNTEGARGGGSVPESVRVLDVSDPAHPRTVQTFSGVTSILPDDARGLIYLANGEGIWILSHQRVLRRHRCSSSDAISSAIPNCD
jgi:hypothetical protein